MGQMRKKVFFLALSITFFIILGVVALFFSLKNKSQPIQKQREKKEEFRIFNVGTQWSYAGPSEEIMKLTITGKKKINGIECLVYEKSIKGKTFGKEYKTQDKKGIKIYAIEQEGQLVKFNPPILAVKYPLKIGLEWVSQFKPSGKKIKSELITSKCKVTEYKRVKVPAGVFKAYKIEHYTYAKEDKKKKEKPQSFDWYNPEVGIVIQENVSPTFEVFTHFLRTYSLQ